MLNAVVSISSRKLLMWLLKNIVANTTAMRNPPLLQSGLWSGWSDARVAWDANFLWTGRQRGPAGSRSRKHSDTSCGGINRNQNNTAQAGKLPSKICLWNTMLIRVLHSCLSQAMSEPTKPFLHFSPSGPLCLPVKRNFASQGYSVVWPAGPHSTLLRWWIS